MSLFVKGKNAFSSLQINLLLEGLLNHPSQALDPSDRSAVELRGLISKLEEAEVSSVFLLLFVSKSVASKILHMYM